MAFPQVAAYNTSVRATSGTSHTVSLPAGISPGDLLLVFFSTDGDNTISNWGGFTQIFSANNGTSAHLSVAYKIALGSDTLTVTTTSSETSAHVSYRITGHNTSQMPQASSGAVLTDANPDPDSLSPTGGQKEYLWFAAEGNDDDDIASAYPLPDNQHTV